MMPSLTENEVKSEIMAKEIYIPSEENFVIHQGAGELLFDFMKKHAIENRVALVNAHTGEEETYASLASKAVRVAQNLRLKGVKPGDVVSLLSYNNLYYTSTVLASLFIGAYNAPMDPTSPIIDIAHCLRITSPKIIFCEADLEETVEKAIEAAGLTSEIVVFEGTERNVPYTDYLIPHETESEDDFKVHKVTDYKSTACIHFSSGTTGLPKAVGVTHYGLLFISLKMKSQFNMVKTSMIVTTPFWISNMNSLVISIISGDRRAICKAFNEKTIMKMVQDYKINILTITPINGAILMQHPEYYNGYDISSLNVMVTGGSPTSAKLFLDYMKAFPTVQIISGYGMTETGGLVLNFVPQDMDDLTKLKRVSIGKPIPGFRYKLVDPESEESVGPNKEGELRVKYDGVMREYLGNPKGYAEAFDSDGFLKTGDILYHDEDYKFYYVTRIKDIFKFKGWHIPPVLIESELLKHPNVSEATVFGVPTETEGEHPTAAVILKNKDTFNEEDLVEFIKERLPDRYHIRGGVYVVDKMPTTSTGKLQRRKLTDMVLKLKNKL